MSKLPLSQFNYSLPEELIAQEPTSKRDLSKLLHFDKKSNEINDISFKNFSELLPKNSVIVVNNTKVIKARVIAKRKTGAQIECFFLEQLDTNQWKIIMGNSKRIKKSETLSVNSNHKIIILEKNGKEAIVSIEGERTGLNFLEEYGNTPLPPYIKSNHSNSHNKRYQSIFAAEPGAVAAPTASLHFSEETFTQLREKQIEIIYITLHIGLGTFNPIISNNIIEHKMHKESYKISKESAKKLNFAKAKNHPIIAIGTTSARCLESNYKNNLFHEENGATSLFIYPGYQFKAINGLLTNFHLPKSSLFILICSLIGIKTTKKIYNHAINKQYRFFSYGDAMLIT